jgi:hypothetical protein
MFLRVILFLDPMDELPIERVQGTQVQLAAEELFTHGAKKSFDFSFGRSVTHRRVMQQAANAGADLDNFLRRVNGAVIDVERLRNPAFIEGRAQSFDKRVHIFGQEELSVAADARSIIQEGDEPGLHLGSLVLEIRADERIGLPHFIDMGFGEGQSDFVGALRVGFEQFILLDHAAKSRVRDLRSSEQTFLDAEAVKHRTRGSPAMKLGQDFADGIEHIFEHDLADFAFV